MEVKKETKNEIVFKCPACGSGEITINKRSKQQYGYCDICDAAYIHYVPLPHQLDVHKCKSKLKLLIGGMGSAKSRAGVMEIINHALSVPNGKTIMMAQTLKQLSSAIMPIFDTYLPRKFVEKWTDTKAEIKITLTNGHIIEGFASDDEEKFRSLDITAFLIEEASGIKPALFQECVRRLRNVNGIIDDVPHFLGVIISNPAQGFIRDLLFSASKIYGSKSIANTVAMYKDRIVNPNEDLTAFLSSSRDNIYLPEGFVESVMHTLTPQQQKLYIDCIIEYAEGAVYPDILTYAEDDFEIPAHWERYIAHDPGINDPAAILLGAVDPETGIIHFYREYYERDKVISQVALAYKEMTKDIPQGCLHMPLIDPSANKRNNINARTYKQQMQLEYGIIFKDAVNAIEDGIQKTKNLFFSGKIRIFRSLKMTLWEGCEYRYPNEAERIAKTNLGDKPIDKDNHLMDCLRYICQELPYDYLDMKRLANINYIKFFDAQNQKTKQEPLSFKELADIIKEDYNLQQTYDKKEHKKHAGGYIL